MKGGEKGNIGSFSVGFLSLSLFLGGFGGFELEEEDEDEENRSWRLKKRTELCRQVGHAEDGRLETSFLVD